MGGYVGLVGADGVHEAERTHQSAEGSQDTEPGLEAAFRVDIAVGVGRDLAGEG